MFVDKDLATKKDLETGPLLRGHSGSTPGTPGQNTATPVWPSIECDFNGLVTHITEGSRVKIPRSSPYYAHVVQYGMDKSLIPQQIVAPNGGDLVTSKEVWEAFMKMTGADRVMKSKPKTKPGETLKNRLFDKLKDSVDMTRFMANGDGTYSYRDIVFTEQRVSQIMRRYRDHLQSKGEFPDDDNGSLAPKFHAVRWWVENPELPLRIVTPIRTVTGLNRILDSLFVKTYSERGAHPVMGFPVQVDGGRDFDGVYGYPIVFSDKAGNQVLFSFSFGRLPKLSRGETTDVIRKAWKVGAVFFVFPDSDRFSEPYSLGNKAVLIGFKTA